MYGSPADPTFNNALLRELRRKGKKCANCQHNIEKYESGGIKRCRYDHVAWPKGPCAYYDERE